MTRPSDDVRNQPVDRNPKSFVKLFTASTGSNLGDGIALAALPLLAASASDDPLAVAGMTVAATLPWLLFGLPAGVIVDRLNHLRLMWMVDIVRALVVGGLALWVWSGGRDLASLYVTVFLLGTAETLFDTAAMSVIPALVPADRLERANGRLFAGQLTANQFVGPPIGGLLFSVAVAVPLAADAATFLVSALIVWRIPSTQLRIDTPVRARPSFVSQLLEGLSWVWRHHDIRLLAIGAGVINLTHAAAMSILVLYAREWLEIDEVGFGLLFTAVAVGALMGSLLASRSAARLGRRNTIILGVAMVAAPMVVIGLTRSVIVTAIGMAVTGLGFELWNVVAVTYRQVATPERLLGRVMSAHRFIAYGTFPLGAVIGGAIASVGNVTTPFIVGGCVVAVLLVYLASALGSLEVGSGTDRSASPPR